MSTNQIKAEVVQHTKSGDTELITVQIDTPKFIVSQINTHRYLSRNYQSSRAMPVLKQMEQIKEAPFMPVYYGTAQKGMVAGEELDGWKLLAAKGTIYTLSRISLLAVKCMQKLGVSKEIANRYLEPWMVTRGIITATRKDWEAFFKLRLNYDSQPEIRVLAQCIKDGIEDSTPFELNVGEWHVPFFEYRRDDNGVLKYVCTHIPSFALDFDINPGEVVARKETTIRDIVRKGTAACGQVSYRTLDLSSKKTDRVYKMLNLPENGVWPEEPPHFSAAEHCAMATDACSQDEYSLWGLNYSGNFHTTDYIQYRKMLEYGKDKTYLK